MADHTLLYYITDRRAFPGNEIERLLKLISKIREAAEAGVDYVQFREKDLPSSKMEMLVRGALSVIRRVEGSRTRLLVNSRADVALATEADGVHLRSDDVSCGDIRGIWKRSGVSLDEPVIGVSCHSLAEVERAERTSANFAVFGPVFEKIDSTAAIPTGLGGLEAACRGKLPVLALGGVTLKNFKGCLKAGAAGIAGIRLFQEGDIAKIARKIRR